LFLSSFIFPLLFRHCFIPVSLAHVVSSLAYPNLLGTKRLGCYCCVVVVLMTIVSVTNALPHHCTYDKNIRHKCIATSAATST
jgi:hypothetical protein